MAEPQRGLTLIEILVVLVIAGILIQAVLVTIPRHDPLETLDTESQRLTRLLQLARDEAVLRAQPFGMLIESQGYRFVSFSRDQWQETEDKTFRARQLPDTITLRLLEGPASQDDKSKPQLVLLDNGSVTPFILGLQEHTENYQHTISGDADGHISRQTQEP